VQVSLLRDALINILIRALIISKVDYFRSALAECLKFTSIAYNLSLMLQFGLCLLRTNQTMSLHGSVIPMGRKSRKESRFGCALLVYRCLHDTA